VSLHQFKLRTMVRGAEDSTGPVLASETDERVLLIGRILPQNRIGRTPPADQHPERRDEFCRAAPSAHCAWYMDNLETIPEYAERHQVLPGLAGLAQVAVIIT